MLWLGDAYDLDGNAAPDMYLHWADYKHQDPLYVRGQLVDPGVSQFGLAYGECTPSPGRDLCTAPLSITVEAPGSLPLSGAVKTGQVIEIRRSRFEVYGSGDLYLHTSGYDLLIGALGSTPEDALARAIGVANQLEGANALGSHITKSTDFEGNSLLEPAPPPTATPR